MVDKSTILACINGDQRAYNSLYNQSVPYVFSIVKRYIFTIGDHKDVVQEAFAQIFHQIKKYDSSKGEFKTFVRIVTVNICLMHLRKVKKMPLLNSLDVLQQEPSFSNDQLAIEQLSRNDIENLLINLPKGYKTIFMLHVIDEFSHAEIGELLSISAETSRSQYFRAKKWIVKQSIIKSKTSSYGLF